VRHIKGSAMSCQYSLVLLGGSAPSRLTNLRTASLADMDLTMRVTQRLAMPAAHFVHAVGH
jgi:hypothetical protein